MTLAPLLSRVDEGLTEAGTLEPGSGHLDLRAAINLEAALVRGEVGWRPLPWLTAYGFGEASKSLVRGPVRAGAGLGLRATF